MKSSLFLIFILLSMTGCVSSKYKSLSSEGLSPRTGARVVTTIREVTEFTDLTTTDAAIMGLGSAVGGALGGAIMSEADYSTVVVNEAKLVDPAVEIRRALKHHLEEFSSVQIIHDPSFLPIDGKLNKYFDQFLGKADYLLDVETIHWGTVYFPMNWRRYRFIYRVKAELYDLNNRATVASSHFFWRTPDGYNHPTHDEMYADGARELKKQLQMAKDDAIQYMTENMLPDR